MQQAKFNVEKSQIDFLNQYQFYGFKDKSAMVREALNQFRQQLEFQQLKHSADLYAEIYAEDAELQESTNTSIAGWSE